MNFVERIAKWVGVDVEAINRPELIEFRTKMEAARAAKRAELFPEALTELDRAAEIADQIGDVMGLSVIRLHRADILTRLGRYDDAKTLIDMVLGSGDGQYPTAPRAYAKVASGVLQLARGEYEAARVTLEDARLTAEKAKSSGAEGRALGFLADTYLREDNASYAAHLLREALPKLNAAGDIELSAQFITQLGTALIGMGDTSEAEQLYSRGLRLAEQIQSRGDLRRLHLALAKRALDVGRYADSYNHFEKGLQFTDEDAPERADVLRDVATACLYLNKYHDATVYAERALALRPDDPAILGTLGAILQASGRAADALPYLEKAIDGDAPDYDSYRALAAAQIDAGDEETGMATLETALEMARKADLPVEVARTLRDVGHVYARQRRMAEAVKTWNAALEIYESQNVYAQAARLLCDIANARLAAGQTARAYSDYERALMLISSVDDPATRGIVLSNAATVYVERGDLETAEAFFTEAIQIAQRVHDEAAEATRRGNFGWFLLSTGRYERARATLQLALELSERLGLRLQAAVQTSNLAITASELGDDDAAEKLHRRALADIDVVDSPRWQSTVRTNFAHWLIERDRIEQARTLLLEARPLAQASRDAEAQSRAAIGLARIDGLDDPAGAAARLLPLINTLRMQGIRRLQADALVVMSRLAAAQGNLEEGRRQWDDAHKLYAAIDHPARKRDPVWLYPPQAEERQP